MTVKVYSEPVRPGEIPLGQMTSASGISSSGGLIHAASRVTGSGRRDSEAFRVGGVGGVEDHLPGGPDVLGPAEVDVGWRVQADAGVAVLVVVAAEEVTAEDPGGGDVAEAPGMPASVGGREQ